MNYYEILGVKQDATQDEIKKGFHAKAQKYHPDKKGGDAEKFKKVSEAYSTLKDEDKRRQYDFTLQVPQGRSFSEGMPFSDIGFDFNMGEFEKMKNELIDFMRRNMTGRG